MYYNLTLEERYILTLSDTMLKEGYTVDEVVEFLQCEDMDQVECILGTLTLTESADVDHPDLELVVERFQSLGRIGSWLTSQAGKLKNVFGRGSQAATKLKPVSGTSGFRQVKSTNPNKGFFSGLRNRLFGPPKKKVTGNVKTTKGDKIKTGLKLAALGGGAALVGMGIDNVMNSDKDKDDDKPKTKDDPNQTTTGGDGDGKDGTDKGYGSRTRAYGWWKRSHSDSPYTSTDHFKNIRRTEPKK